MTKSLKRIIITARPLNLLLVGVVCVTSAFAVLGALSWFDTDIQASPSVSGEQVLFVSAGDRSNPALVRAIEEFEASGFTVTDDRDTALSLAESTETVAFIVTRNTFNEVPSQRWADLYLRHAVVGGLDVSLYELQPLARPGSSVGEARLRFTPDRAIFSLMHSAGGCSRGAMSDWLDRWNVSGLVQQRATEIARSESLDSYCESSEAPGGNR